MILILSFFFFFSSKSHIPSPFNFQRSEPSIEIEPGSKTKTFTPSQNQKPRKRTRFRSKLNPISKPTSVCWNRNLNIVVPSRTQPLCIPDYIQYCIIREKGKVIYLHHYAIWHNPRLSFSFSFFFWGGGIKETKIVHTCVFYFLMIRRSHMVNFQTFTPPYIASSPIYTFINMIYTIKLIIW